MEESAANPAMTLIDPAKTLIDPSLPLIVPIVLERPAVRDVVSSDTTYYAEWASFFVRAKIDEMRVKIGQAGMWWIQQQQEAPYTQLPPADHPLFAEHALPDQRATPEQRAAFLSLAEGNNVCILGPGGTGKSQMIHWVRDVFLELGNTVIVTASTANAAFLLGGMTLHRFAGLPIYCCDESKYNLVDAFGIYVRHVQRLFRIATMIVSTHLWICDEISMLSPRVFVLVDLAFRFFRNNPNKPFGGCQFLWSGDFLQIPPVQSSLALRGQARRAQVQPAFLFEHDAWFSSWKPWIVPFSTNKRSKAAEWSQLLARVRLGAPTEDDILILKSRTLSSLKFRGEAHAFFSGVVTHIYPTNADVNRENNLYRERLFGSDHLFECSFSVTTNVCLEWCERDQRFYDMWCFHGGAIPNKWFPQVDRGQRLCDASSPWFLVLARSIRLEQGYFSRAKNQSVHAITDDECVAALKDAAHKFLEETRLPNVQTFRLEEKVRMTVNLAQSCGLVNGTTGRIVGFCCQDMTAPWVPNWNDINIRQLKKFLNQTFEHWYTPDIHSYGEVGDDQDLWHVALVVSSKPRTLEQLGELRASSAVTFAPVDRDLGDTDMPALAQIRACWYGSTALSPVQDLAPGDFVWSDEVDASFGLPVIEWSTGLRTILPKYDWSQDYSGLMAQASQPNQKQSSAKQSSGKQSSGKQSVQGKQSNTIKPIKDRWQIHIFGLPIKPAHAMTYHDCQGQTCQKVLLGNISRLFSTNMLYVGLSRAPSPDCIVLSDDFYEKHILQDAKAIDFFKLLSPAE